MRMRYRVALLCLGPPVFFWLLDSLLDYLVFYEGSLVGLMLTHVPSHELYVRLTAGGILAAAGAVLAFVHDRLRKSERRYRNFFRTSGEAAFITTPQGEWVEVNDALVEMFGYENREELEKISVQDVYADPAERKEHLRLIYREGFLKEKPIRFKTKSGRILETLVTSVPVTDEEGEITALQGTIRDVTEQKEAQRALKNSEHFLRSTLDALPANIAVLDGEGTILRVNESWRQFGDENDLEWDDYGVGRNYLDIIRDTSGTDSPENAEEVRRGIENLLSGEKKEIRIEYPCHSPDQRRWFVMAGASFDTEAGRRAVLAHVDVTERKLAEKRVRDREERFRRTVAHAPLPIMVHAEDGEVLTINQVWTDMTGYTARELETIDEWAEKAYGDRKEDVKGTIEDLYRADGPTREGEFTIHCKDGSTRTWDFSSAPVGRTRDGRQMIVSMAVDVTERRAAEQRIRGLNSVLRAVRNVNQMIVEEDDAESLLRRACQVLLEARQYQHVWAVTFDDEGQVRYSGCAGIEESFEVLVSRMKSGWRPDCVRRALAEPGAPFILEPSRDCSECPLAGLYEGCSAVKCGFADSTDMDGVLSIRRRPGHEADQEEKDLIAEVAGDISHGLRRLEMEERVETSETRYRRLFETAQDGMLILDADTGQIIDVNPFVKNILGYSQEELVGKQLWQIGTFRDIAENQERFSHLVDKGYVRYEDLPLQARDGGEVDVEFVSNTYEAGGKQVVQCNIRDITDRKRAEAKARLRTRAMEASVNGIAIIDLEGTIVDINRAALNMWGVNEKSEVVGMKAGEIWQSRQEARAAMETAIEQREWEGEMTAQRRDGSTFPAGVYMSTVKDAEGQITHVLGVFLDLTERKRKEEELQRHRDREVQMERLNALGQMASGIAHDIRNGIGPVLGYADLLLNNPDVLDDREKLRQRLKRIRQAAEGVKETVERLRQFYRERSGRENFEEIDLNTVVQNTVSLTEPKWKEEARSQGVEVFLETELSEIPSVSGNAAELREMLTNLIFNAVDAMPEGGTLTIRTRPDRDREAAILSVEDTGEGMTEQQRRNCLEPFFTTKGTSGSGLGLATVFGTVERHGGDLEIESEPCEGTTVTVRLPATQGIPEGPIGKNEGGPLTSPLHVLVVEDDAAMCSVFVDLLEADGHEVETAQTGRAGLEKSREQEFDLVVTDQAMPEMNGEKMAEAIKEDSPDIAILMVTGFSGAVEEKHGLVEHIDKLIHKPITHGDLQRAITQLVSEMETD